MIMTFDPGLVDYTFFVTILICLTICLYAIVKVTRRSSNTNGEKGTEDQDDEVVTTLFDDFFPFPRKILVETKPQKEDGYHKKLNYQFLIERMTRKLYLAFFAIIIFSTSFIYILYRTSLTEQITPDESVMKNYQIVLSEVIAIESQIEEDQMKPIDAIDIPDAAKIKLKTKVAEEAIKYEDELVSDVSQKFFSIYYFRYIAVRILIALVMFFILRYVDTPKIRTVSLDN